MRIAFELKTARGVGDAICGLYAAAGIAAAGHSVIMSTDHHEWMEGCETEAKFGKFGHTGLDASSNYAQQLVVQRAGHGSRAKWYIQMLANRRDAEALRSVEPIVPAFNFPLLKRPVDRPYIVLSPFSAHEARRWAPQKWRELAASIAAEGICPLAIGSGKEARELGEMFGKIKGAHFFWAQSPQWVRSTMRQSIGFVGNDSGMAHVAASLGVPTVAVVSHIKPSFVFSPARVTAVVPDPARFACRFCGWQAQFQYRHGHPCLPDCSALQSISVASVFNAVRETCLQQQEEIAA